MTLSVHHTSSINILYEGVTGYPVSRSIGFSIKSHHLSVNCCLEQHKQKGRKMCPLCAGSSITAPPSGSALRQPGPAYLCDLLIHAALCHDFGMAEVDAEIGFCDANRL